MKKLFFSLIIIMLCLSVHAQITKIHSFDNNMSVNWGALYGVSITSYIGECYYYMDNNTVYIYNWDFSLNRTWSIVHPDGYDVSILYGSKQCINNDDKWEFIVIYQSQDFSYLYPYPECNNYYKAWIINEDNTLIQDLGCAYHFNFYYFHKHGNEVRCMLYKTYKNEDSSYTYDYGVYRCAGNGGDLGTNELTNNILEPAYPNPAHNTITIPYSMNGNQASEMHIYDIQGRLVKTIQVGPHFNEVHVDVSSFPSGTYIYECDGGSNKFIVN